MQAWESAVASQTGARSMHGVVVCEPAMLCQIICLKSSGAIAKADVRHVHNIMRPDIGVRCAGSNVTLPGEDTSRYKTGQLVHALYARLQHATSTQVGRHKLLPTRQ